MKYCLFGFIVIILLVFKSSAQTNAQSSELKEAEQLSAQVVRLYQSGKFNDALPLAERALILREKALGADTELVAAALRNLAEVQLARKNTKEAEVTYDRYLSVYGKAVGESNSKFVSALERYICLLVGINRREKALEAQKRLFRLDNKFDYVDTEQTPSKKI